MLLSKCNCVNFCQLCFASIFRAAIKFQFSVLTALVISSHTSLAEYSEYNKVKKSKNSNFSFSKVKKIKNSIYSFLLLYKNCTPVKIMPSSPPQQGKLSKGYRKTKAPKNDDFGGPKKPRSSFFEFNEEKRSGITAERKAANPNSFKISMVGGKLGELWKGMGRAEKTLYEETAKKELEEFNSKMEEWKKTAEYKNFLKAQGKTKDDNSKKA